MAFHHLLPLLLSFFFFFHAHASAIPAVGPIGSYCNPDRNLTTSQIKFALPSLLGQLVQKSSGYGFATAYSGTLSGLVQCRQDVSREDCSACIADAAKQVRSRCPTQAEARLWYDYCFLRYSAESFIGQADTTNGLIYLNVNSFDGDGRKAFDVVEGLMKSVQKEAVGHLPSSQGLGDGSRQLSSSPAVTIYGLVQCTQDLSRLSCKQCLELAVGNFTTYCQYKVGCQVNFASCRARYEIYPFFFPLDANQTAAAAAAASLQKKVME